MTPPSSPERGPVANKELTLRLPGLKPGVCSGLILSGALNPDLKVVGLAPSKVSKIDLDKEPLSKFSYNLLGNKMG